MGWDGMGGAGNSSILTEEFTHRVTSAADPVPSQRVCECTIKIFFHTKFGRRQTRAAPRRTVPCRAGSGVKGPLDLPHSD